MTHYNQLQDMEDKDACKDFELKVTVEESSGNRIYLIYFNLVR